MSKLSLSPLRSWTDRSVDKIEDAQLRDYARAVYPFIHHIFIIVLVLAGASVIGKILNIFLKIVELSPPPG